MTEFDYPSWQSQMNAIDCHGGFDPALVLSSCQPVVDFCFRPGSSSMVRLDATGQALYAVFNHLCETLHQQYLSILFPPHPA